MAFLVTLIIKINPHKYFMISEVVDIGISKLFRCSKEDVSSGTEFRVYKIFANESKEALIYNQTRLGTIQ